MRKIDETESSIVCKNPAPVKTWVLGSMHSPKINGQHICVYALMFFMIIVRILKMPKHNLYHRTTVGTF